MPTVLYTTSDPVGLGPLTALCPVAMALASSAYDVFAIPRLPRLHIWCRSLAFPRTGWRLVGRGACVGTCIGLLMLVHDPGGIGKAMRRGRAGGIEGGRIGGGLLRS